MLMRTLPVAAALALTLTACGGDSSEESTEESGPACAYPAAGEPATEVSPPPTDQQVSGKAEVTLATNRGEIDLTLDGENAPCTVTSFVSLAQQDYYDGTDCHRLTTEGIFVLQCGDPTGSGAGGPGYSFADELDGSETYPAGTVAMANAGPDTNGSQFFLVYKDTPLPAKYTVFGTIGEPGMQVLKKIAQAGSDNANGPGDGAPNQRTTITDVALDDSVPSLAG